MPPIRTRLERRTAKTYALIRQKMRERKLHNPDLAKELHKTASAVSMNFQRENFTYADLLRIFEFLQFSDLEKVEALTL